MPMDCYVISLLCSQKRFAYIWVIRKQQPLKPVKPFFLFQPSFYPPFDMYAQHTRWNFSPLYEFVSSISYVSQATEHRKNTASLSTFQPFFFCQKVFARVRENKTLRPAFMLATDVALSTTKRQLTSNIADDPIKTAQCQ